MQYDLFPYRPSMPTEESYEWVTDILEAHLGNEQRLKIRKFPRQKFEWVVHVSSNSHFAKLKSMLFGNFENRFIIPVWTEAQRIDSSFISGSTSLNVDTKHYDFQNSQYISLWEDETFNEFVEIQDVSDNTITLKTPLIYSYSSLSFIMPAKRAYLEQTNTFDIYSHVKEINLFWRVEFNKGIEALELETQYKDYDVLADPFDIDGNSITKEIRQSLNKIDYQIGSIEVFSRMDWHRQSIQNVHFDLVGREKIWNFKRWLHNISGRLNSFWIPNFEHDIQVIEYGTTLIIENIFYYRYLQDNPMFQNIICYKYDGSVEIRKITGCSEISNSEETITLNSGLGDPDDIKAIYFLGLYRLDTDRVELSHEEENVVSVTFPVIGVEE